MRARWQIEPLVSSRALGEQFLVYHAGSGDTHLLPPLSGEIVVVLAEPDNGQPMSMSEIREHDPLASRPAGERELADALELLQEAGIVRAVTDA